MPPASAAARHAALRSAPCRRLSDTAPPPPLVDAGERPGERGERAGERREGRNWAGGGGEGRHAETHGSVSHPPSTGGTEFVGFPNVIFTFLVYILLPKQTAYSVQNAERIAQKKAAESTKEW